MNIIRELSIEEMTSLRGGDDKGKHNGQFKKLDVDISQEADIDQFALVVVKGKNFGDITITQKADIDQTAVVV